MSKIKEILTIFDEQNPEGIEDILSSYSLEEKDYDALLKTGSDTFITYLATYSKLPENIMLKLEKYENRNIRIMLGKNINLSEKLFFKLGSDPDMYVRNLIISNPNIPAALIIKICCSSMGMKSADNLDKKSEPWLKLEYLDTLNETILEKAFYEIKKDKNKKGKFTSFIASSTIHEYTLIENDGIEKTYNYLIKKFPEFYKILESHKKQLLDI